MSVESEAWVLAPGTVRVVEIVIDLALGTAALSDPDDLERFSVRALGAPDPEVLAAVLAETRTGRLAGSGDAYVDPDAVRRLARGAAGEGWDERFAAMLAFAATKGWTDASDGSVQGHVVWDEAR